MKAMTYRDVPVLRSNGFHLAPSGHSWYARDCAGGEWQAELETDFPRMLFVQPDRSSTSLTREQFNERFICH